MPCVGGGRFFSVGRSASSVESGVEAVVESDESDVRRCIVGRFGSSEDPEEAVFDEDGVDEAAESEVVVSLESERRCNTGRFGSSDAGVVVTGVFAGVESAEAVVSEELESVRRCIVGREESPEDVDGVAPVELASPEPLESELPESVRRRIVGRDESSAVAVVELALPVLLPSCGRFPPLATICGSGPLFFAAYTGPWDAGLNSP